MKEEPQKNCAAIAMCLAEKHPGQREKGASRDDSGLWQMEVKTAGMGSWGVWAWGSFPYRTVAQEGNDASKGCFNKGTGFSE